ncbi:MAG TPA: transposase [Terriglobales bacterium]|nr:transposase [Terriglobales bacterium]
MIKEPLKQILESTRYRWDSDHYRPVVRDNFNRMINCRTLALGAEVFASDSEEKIVAHTCKSRSCPSCGHRATALWQREQWTDLPDIPYAGLVFTMPDALWPIFRQNRHLLYDLPRLGAAVIQQLLKAQYGVQVLILVVEHTFGRSLTFNPHLHILVSAGGLQKETGQWVDNLLFDRNKLMQMWRYAVITFLRRALKAKVLKSDRSASQLQTIFTAQYERWWNIDVAHFKTKWQFLRYAGRYVRRPPIAQHRFEKITGGVVEFWRKDLKVKKLVLTSYPIEQFVSLLAEHVHDRYRHAIRYFGLLAPVAKHRTSAAMFMLLGQEKQARPRRLSWRNALRKDFNFDPLLDSRGREMSWVRRLRPRPV